MLSLEIASIVPLHWGCSHELHEDSNFASITVHEKVDNLVDVVRLLDERDTCLLSATRSFHSALKYFFCRNLPGIRVFWISAWRSARIGSLCRSRRVLICSLSEVSLRFLGARHKWANNGSHRSIMTNWRRQTGRQTFSFRVIGSSSARIREGLADGDVTVAEVFREPLLARGLLGVFDKSLCDEVVVGLMTCGGVILGQGAKVLSGSVQGVCPPHPGSWRCRAVGTARWSERWWGKRWSEWRSRRDQEQDSQRDDTCACNVGWFWTWALSALEPMQCAYIWRKTVKGRWHWQQKRKTTKTNKLSCGSIHSVHESLDVLVGFLNASVHCTFCWACRSVWRIHLLSMHQTYSLSDLYGNSL